LRVVSHRCGVEIKWWHHRDDGQRIVDLH
jgi:hypothetical protein